jgi:hypothetical protein
MMDSRLHDLARVVLVSAYPTDPVFATLRSDLLVPWDEHCPKRVWRFKARQSWPSPPARNGSSKPALASSDALETLQIRSELVIEVRHLRAQPKVLRGVG